MNKWLGPVFLIAAAAIWGGMYVVSKVVLETVPPWVLLEMRFVIGLVVLGIWAWYANEWKIAFRDLKAMALIGLIGYTGSIGFQFVGTHLSGASLGALITSASPALISLFAWKLLREKPDRKKVFSLVIATLGVMIVIGLPSDPGSAPFIGNIILFGAAVTWALYTVLSRVQTLKYSSLTVTLWANLFGVIFTFPMSWWEWQAKNAKWPVDGEIWLGILYLGIISTALAFYFWNKGFQYIDTSAGSLFFFFQPIVPQTRKTSKPSSNRRNHDEACTLLRICISHPNR
ncbi:DMT family transporter [Thermoactinomyces mirandus]|uniref:DMT family transporter n=1 Tax=Thermoactinomyces mirandus TaxID=2756294 RepID=A0A7W1XUV0_9BACL|nr:DMT family transporter [Thermoactinomyces mirandus]MBA4603616.1 DMT family transporter [Thermoactinomyces mirandus]